MLTRRRFLGYGAAGLTVVSFGRSLPTLFAQAAEGAAAADLNDHVLVVVELNGGNDGLNTLVPFENPLYYQNRPTLGIAKDEVVKLSDQVGLHPSLSPLGELFKQGQLAVVQGVGYPEPDRSHFRSMEIWHTASTAGNVPTAGWLGRVLDSQATDEATLAGLSLTYSLPQAMQADRVVVPVVAQLEELVGTGEDTPAAAQRLRRLSTAPGAKAGSLAFLRRQADTVYRAADQLREAAANYKSTIEYPGGELGPQMQRAAQIIAADLGVRVLFVSQGGYDTHSGQAGDHTALMSELGESMAAFQKDLEGLGVADKVATMVFSEFGRRVDENGSLGTDHGAASCMFLAGSKVKGGLHGTYPSLEQLGDGDLLHTTDFRSVYGPVLDRWLGCPSEALLGEKFPALEVVT